MRSVRIKSPRAVIFIIISVVYLYVLYTSWGKWGSLLIDTFRDIGVVSKMLSGEKLYEGINYAYGFLPPYILIAFVSVFGMSVNALAFFGAMTAAVLVFLLYRISRYCLDDIGSSLVALTFILTFCCGAYIYFTIFNFILPYSGASVFFILFYGAAVYFAIRYFNRQDRLSPLLWVFFSTSAFFCRIELASVSWAAVFLVFSVYAYKERKIYPVLYAILPPFLGLIGYYLYLSCTGTTDAFMGSVFTLIDKSKTNSFVLSTIGLDNLGRNIWLMAKSLALHCIVIISLCAGSNYVCSTNEKHKNILGVALIFTVFVMSKEFLNDMLQFRCYPLVALSGAAYYFMGAIKKKEYRADFTLFALLTAGFAPTLRVVLVTVPALYGFYLLPLGLPGYYAVIFRLSSFISGKTGEGQHNKQVLYSLTAVFFLWLSIQHWQISDSFYKAKSLMMKTDRGAYCTYKDVISTRMWEAISYMTYETPEDSTVIVMPEGEGITYFSMRRTPLKYESVNPVLINMVGEEKLISEFERAAADYIVITQRDNDEHGASRFGKDYAVKLDAWIREKYELVKCIGPYPFTKEKDFGIAIYKSRPVN